MVAFLIALIVIHSIASTNLPIKLTPNNFPVWRYQIEFTIIGLELDQFLTDKNLPKKSIVDKKGQNRTHSTSLGTCKIKSL